MALTITIQAASDSTMTDTGKASGTLLADDDLRKVYGLPNQYIQYDGNLKFVEFPRWDIIKLPQGPVGQYYKNGVLQIGEVSKTMLFESQQIADVTNPFKGVHRPPTTTAFQLRCNSISHDASDMTSVAPMPGISNAAGVNQAAGTPGQLHNLVIAFGMRSEVIKLEGVLVDAGPITASNPRKQVLMNIARLQYFKTGRSGRKESWGGTNGGPLNPRSYPCLTIFDSGLNSLYDDSYQITQPSGTNLSYRGLIKSFSFRQEGGRPNQWFWTMEFQILQNEWPQGQQFMGKGVLEGMLRINRIRLINSSTGGEVSSFPTDIGEAVVEVRTSDELKVPLRLDDNTIAETLHKVVSNNQTIFITNSDSTPKIDGDWFMYDVDSTTRTFRLRNIGGLVVTGGAFADAVSYGEPDMDRAWTSFTNGSDGYVKAGGGETLQTEEASLSTVNEMQAAETLYGGP
jgi:hypothetical protein